MSYALKWIVVLTGALATVGCGTKSASAVRIASESAKRAADSTVHVNRAAASIATIPAHTPGANNASSPMTTLTVVVGNSPEMCSGEPSSLQVNGLRFSIARFGDQVPAGAYEVSGSHLVTVSNTTTDVDGTVQSRCAVSGRITIDSYDAASIAGSYNLSFGDEHLSGSWHADICSNATALNAVSGACASAHTADGV